MRFAEIVAWHGLSGRCASIRMLDGGFKSIDDVQSEKEELLVELANRTVKQDAADVVIRVEDFPDEDVEQEMERLCELALKSSRSQQSMQS